MTRLEIGFLCVAWSVAVCSCSRPDEPLPAQPPQPLSVAADTVRTPVMNGIPVVCVNYAGELHRSSYADAQIQLCYNGWNGRFDTIPSRGGVKLHGNTTAGRDKKPYKLKLETGRDYFGFGSSRHWVLLANYFDASLLRNYTAMAMGRALGMKDTPDCRYVDVVENGRYQGNYLLCETPEIRPSRVNHAQYLIEVDRRYGERDCVLHIPMIGSDDTDICYRIEEPTDPTLEQQEWLLRYFSRYDSLMVAAALPDDGPQVRASLRAELDALVDFDSFVGFWLVQELFRNPDSWYNTSVWMSIKEDGKLHMGPLWDFDLGAGNYSTIDAAGDRAYGFSQTEGYHVFTIPYVRRYLNLYWPEAQRYWREHRASLLELIARLDGVDEGMRPSFRANFELWNSSDFVNGWCGYGHEANVEYLYSWLLARYEWMNQVFNQTGI